jgi:transposase InsO family protein
MLMTTPAFVRTLANSRLANWLPLIRIQDIGLAVRCQRFLKRLNAKGSLHRDRNAMRKNASAENVDYCGQIDEATGWRMSRRCSGPRPKPGETTSSSNDSGAPSNTRKIYLRAYDSVLEARASIARYLAFYNRGRPHSSLDDRTPDEA